MVKPCTPGSVHLPVSGNGQGNNRRRGTGRRRSGQDLGTSVEWDVVESAHTLTPAQSQDGTKNVPVGRVIALLAEEGDDISNLEAPKEVPKPAPASTPETSAAPSPPPSSLAPEPAQEPKAHSHHPTHSKHLMPSVVRLLIEGGVTNAEVIKGTGVRGMLTKGDVLAYLGRASNPLGTYKPPQKEAAAPTKTEPPPKVRLAQSLRNPA